MGGAMGMFMQQMMGNRQQAMGGEMGMFMQQMMGSNGVGAAMEAGGNHMMLQMFQQFVKQQVMAQMAGKDVWGWPWVIDPSNRPIKIVLQNLSTQEDIAESEILTFWGGF